MSGSDDETTDREAPHHGGGRDARSHAQGGEERPIEVPWTALDPATLRRVAEEFVTRDGTDYGARERSLEEKTEALLARLRSGDARLYYEAVSGSIHIVPAAEPR